MQLQIANQLIKLNQESYSKIADDFSDTRFFPWQEVEQVIKDYVKDNNKILDLGCGNGRLLKSLAKFQNINYTGLDNNTKLLEKIQAFTAPRGVSPRVKLICDDILNLAQFKNNEFDIIFMIASFHHIPSNELRQKVMANLHRILKPNGYLIMTNWNLWQAKAKKNIWFYKIRQNRKQEIKGLKFRDVITYWQNKYPLYYYTFIKKELKKYFKQVGFKILKNRYVKNGKKVHWWDGYNILTVGQK